MVSFQKATADGWRWAPGYRTRRYEGGYWLLQRWNGEDWEHVCRCQSYGEARQAATQDRTSRR